MKTYMKGQLELMNKPEVVKIYVAFRNKIKKPITVTEANKIHKTEMIKDYLRLRNKLILG